MADYDSSLPVRTENDGDVVAKIGDGTTPANQWEIVSTKEGVVTVRESASGNELVVNTDGSINANIVTTQIGDDVHIYDTAVAGVPSTPVTVISYTVTTGKTLALKAISVASSGKSKFELLAGTPTSETVRAVGFISTASGIVEVVFPQPIEIAGDDNVLVVITNIDKANQDLYAFINGVEV